MLRIITRIWVLLVMSLWCLGSEEPRLEPPVYRYLIVVEASASMVRQKDVALDTIHELILSGFQGRIQRGDVLGIWPFKDQVDQKLTRPIHWSAREARDLSNFIYRKLRDLDFSRKSELRFALEAVKAEARRSERLTVFLVTSGAEDVLGTPYDAEINAVFQQHREAMSKAKRPFVTVLVFEGAQVVAQAVTPGGRTIYVPPTPSTMPALAAEAVSEAAEVEIEPPAPEPAPRPKPMTVEEIAAKLREAQAQRAVVETEPGLTESAAVAEPAEEPEPDSAEARDSAMPITEDSAPAIALEEAMIEPEPELVAEIPMVAVAPVVEHEEPPVEPDVEDGHASSLVWDDVPPLEEAEPLEEGEPVRGAEERGAGVVEVSSPEEAPAAGIAGGAEPVSPGLVLPPDGGPDGRVIYLGAGIALFTVALVMVLLRLRRPRRRGRASVISQSMHPR